MNTVWNKFTYIGQKPSSFHVNIYFESSMVKNVDYQNWKSKNM